MKKSVKMSKLFLASILVSVLLFFPGAVWASTLSLSPGSGSIGVGGVLTVSVRLNTAGEGINGVSAYLSYPTDKLDVSYVSGGSAFAIEAENSFGGGVIKISRGSINAVSGSIGVATIGFKGKALGSATVAFIGGSAAPRAADSSDSLSLGASSGGVYSIVTAAAPVVKPEPDQTNQPVTTPIVQKVPLPKISEVKISDIATSSATVFWKTDRQTLSEVDYGLDKDKYFLNASDGNLVTDHTIKLEGPLLTPGAKLHLKVISRDDIGNLAQSEDMALQLLGYKINIKIVDGFGRPLKRTPVLLYSDPVQAVTDQNGEVSFDNVTLGKHLLVIKDQLFEKTAEVEVGNSPSQSFKIQTNQTQWKGLAILGLVIIVTIAILSLVVIFWRRRHKKEQTGVPPIPYTSN